MPEGHAIHRLAAMLDDLFGGEALAVSSPQGRFAAGASVLDGRALLTGRAHGKQLFLGFGPRGSEPADEGGAEVWLRVHLGLYGAWTFAGDSSIRVVHAIGAPRRRVGENESTSDAFDSGPDAPGLDAPGLGAPEPGRPSADGIARTTEERKAEEPGATPTAWRPPPPRGAVRVRLAGAHAVADLTGPSACEVLTSAERDAAEAGLGPDPLIPGSDTEAFVARVGRSRVGVGQLLMDQSVLAGVGNIYRAEVLFRARIDPLTPGRDVDPARLRAVWDDLVLLMADGVARGRIITTDDDAEPHWVYHRDGLPCRVCGSPILVKELAGRNLFWCAVCQN